MTLRTVTFTVACDVEGGNITPEAVLRSIENAMNKAISAGDGLGLEHDEGYVTRCKGYTPTPVAPRRRRGRSSPANTHSTEFANGRSVGRRGPGSGPNG
jgi:hypothetical protein